MIKLFEKIKMIKLGIFTTHPIQYFCPIWKKLALKPQLDMTVYFFSDNSLRNGFDPGFNKAITWDIDLLSGYKSVFISHDANLNNPWSIKIPHAYDFLKSNSFDCILIQGYTYGFAVQIRQLRSRLKNRLIFQGELTDRRRPFALEIIHRTYLSWFYKEIHHFGVIGENARRHLIQHGISESQMTFCPYSVDTDLFEKQRTQFSREKSRRDLNLAPTDFVIIFSGKFIPRKNPLLLLQAIAKLKRDDIKCILMGEGPMNQEIQSFAHRYLPHQLIFQGFVNQSQLGKFYQAADLAVLPSKFETWGLAVNEAMQFGLPVIVSDGVGSRFDLVKPGVTGYVFPEGDVNALALYIEKLVNQPMQVKQMGIHARNLISLFYNNQFTVEGIYQAVQSTMNHFI